MPTIEECKAARDDFQAYCESPSYVPIKMQSWDTIRTILDQAIKNAELLKQADEFFDSINEQFPDALENGRKQLAEIAASREAKLLEALKGLIDADPDNEAVWMNAVDIAKKAIAEAEGE